MMRISNTALVCLLALWMTCCNVLSADDPATENDPPSLKATEVDKAIHLAAGYLARATLPNGEFIYLANPDPRYKSPVEYHVVRHAAVLYLFSNYLQHYDDPAVLEAWKRASAFLNKCCVAPPPGRNDQLAVWSLPQLHKAEIPVEADIGATGLALVGLAGLEARAPGSVDMQGLRAFGRFLLSMQGKDGRFFAKFTPEKGGARHVEYTLYYPGEAVLGLLALYRIDPSPKWLHGAVKAMVWLFENQSLENTKRRGDHWTLLATAELQAVTGGRGLPFEPAYLHKQIARISKELLANLSTQKDPMLIGAVYDKGYTTPTATRLEGLLATVDLLPTGYSELRKQILEFARDGIGFLMRTQIRSGPFTGGIPYAISGQDRSNAPNRRDSEVRIDYVQHAIGAMLAWRRLPEN